MSSQALGPCLPCLRANFKNSILQVYFDGKLTGCCIQGVKKIASATICFEIISIFLRKGGFRLGEVGMEKLAASPWYQMLWHQCNLEEEADKGQDQKVESGWHWLSQGFAPSCVIAGDVIPTGPHRCCA